VSDVADFAHWIGFALKEGPACTMHFQCSILDINDEVLRVVSNDDDFDYREAPVETAPVGEGAGTVFNLTAADKAGAVRVL